MEFSIDTSSRLPIFRQLNLQVREAIARGMLRPDERLPSVRELSRRLVVNPNTIARVYRDLTHAGLLDSRLGQGVFVAKASREVSRVDRQERLAEAMDQCLTEAVHLGFEAKEVIAALSERMKRFQWPKDA